MKSKNTLHVNYVQSNEVRPGFVDARILHGRASSQNEPTKITDLEDSRSLVKGLKP